MVAQKYARTSSLFLLRFNYELLKTRQKRENLFVFESQKRSRASCAGILLCTSLNSQTKLPLDLLYNFVWISKRNISFSCVAYSQWGIDRAIHDFALTIFSLLVYSHLCKEMGVILKGRVRGKLWNLSTRQATIWMCVFSSHFYGCSI